MFPASQPSWQDDVFGILVCLGVLGMFVLKIKGDPERKKLLRRPETFGAFAILFVFIAIAVCQLIGRTR